MISTRLTERFGIRHPIVCAPMAYVTGGVLAAAVSRAGGLGIVGGGYAGTVGGEPDLEAELAQAKSGKFGVGFITWALERAPKMLTKAGMVEGGRGLGLTPETLERLAVLGHACRKELQSDKTVKTGILRLVDHTHAASAEFLDDSVMRDGLADHYYEMPSFRVASSYGRGIR